MVQYNWKKLANAPVAGDGAFAPPSFWNNAADRTNDIKSEFGNLEELFGAKKTTTLPKPEGGGVGAPMSPALGHDDKGKHTAVTLLDFKRVQNLCMFLFLFLLLLVY